LRISFHGMPLQSILWMSIAGSLLFGGAKHAGGTDEEKQ
jgi:hypothetical protein